MTDTNNLPNPVDSSSNSNSDIKKKMEEYIKSIKDMQEKLASLDCRKLLQATITGLINKHPFYGTLLQSMPIQLDTRLPTAAIGYDKATQQFRVFVNPLFLDAMKHKQRVGVMQHEILHFVMQHTMRFDFADEEEISVGGNKLKKRDLYNISADCAINQLISDLPPGCVDVKNFKDKNGNPFPLLQTAEVYYKLFSENPETLQQTSCSSCGGTGKKKKQSQSKSGEEGKGDSKDAQPGGCGEDKCQDKGCGGHEGDPCPDCKGQGQTGGFVDTMDSHDWTDNLTDEEKKAMYDAARDVVKRTLDKVGHGYAEEVPGIKDLLQALDEKVSKLDCKRILSEIIKRTATGVDRKTTYTRPNKRYGYTAPGTKVGDLPKIAFWVDTSGSISIRELNEFLRVMDQFLSVGERKSMLGFFHCNVYNIRKYKRGEEVTQGEIESGGTELEDVMKNINKLKADCNIILTDGCYGGVTTSPKHETVFIISSTGSENHPLTKLGKTFKLSSIK